MIALAGLVLVAVLLTLAGCLSQRGMLYQPGFADLEDVRALARKRGLRLWPRSDSGYLGLVAEPSETVRGTVIVFHGNADVAGQRAFYADALTPLGFRVVLAEYPGYGGRPGEMTESVFAADARSLVTRAREAFGPPVYLWGESLGAAVAASAVEAGARAEGVVMFTPWDTLLRVARHHFSWLPVQLFMRDRYHNIENLADYPGPVAVVVAEHDQVLPPRLGRSLYRRLPPPSGLWEMSEAGHNDWNIAPRNPLWRRITDWLETGGAVPPTGAEAVTTEETAP